MIDEARRTHPFVARGGERQASGAFRPIDLADPFDRPAPGRPVDAAAMSFEAGGLRRVRAFVTWPAERAWLDFVSATAMVLAVSEIATNSVRHGGGQGELRAWVQDRSLVCEVSDRGHITSPLVGRVRPVLNSGGGAGLWVANQLCDLVQIFSSPLGTTVRVYQDI